jgi:hypothetical protein
MNFEEKIEVLLRLVELLAIYFGGVRLLLDGHEMFYARRAN